jgi:hypothetical protein
VIGVAMCLHLTTDDVRIDGNNRLELNTLG